MMFSSVYAMNSEARALMYATRLQFKYNKSEYATIARHVQEHE